MPYPGIPESMTSKMEQCVQKVMAQGHSKDSAIAICHVSLMGGKSYLDAVTKGLNMNKSIKHGTAYTGAMQDHVQAIHDHAQTMGAECKTSTDEGKALKFAAKYAEAQGMTPDAYAAQECQDLQDASQVLYQLASLAAGETYSDEPDEVKKLCELMRGLVGFISGEIDEVESNGGNAQEEMETGEGKSAKSKITIPTYIKSLHLPYKEQFVKDVLAAKFVGKNEIEHAVFLWGDPQTVDLETDFFTSRKSALGATDFWDGRIGLPKPLTWNHAQDRGLMKGSQLIGDTAEFYDTDVARFARSVMNRHHEYFSAVSDMIGKRMLGSSSDSAPQYVQREKQKNGSHWIKEWAWFATSLTDVPCEPRMLDIGSPIWKTIGVDAKLLQQRMAEAGLSSTRHQVVDSDWQDLQIFDLKLSR